MPNSKGIWRPLKINERRLKKADEILNKDINTIILTDEELCLLINEWLEEKDRISYRTFQSYKASCKWWDNVDENLDVDNETRGTLDDFLRLYKKALITQRNNLFANLQTDDKSRQRRAWIIERKFDDWNIRIKQDVENKHSWDIKIKRNLS